VFKTLSYKTRLVISLGLVYIIWGSTFLAVKYAIVELPPMLLSGIRFFVGGTILLAFTLFQGKGLPSQKQWLGAGLVGLLLSGIGNSAVANALNFMPSGLVALLVATLPAWMIILDYFFFSHKKPHIIAIIGLFLGFVGMGYLLYPSLIKSKVESAEVLIFPTLLVFGGSITWAWGSLLSPTLQKPKSQLQSTAVQMIAGGIFSLIVSLFTESNHIESIKNMSFQTYKAMAYLIFIGSFVGYTAYVWLINNAPAQVTATYAYINPIVAIILGWIFKDESLSTNTYIASGIILLGVILMTKPSKPAS
jgi:drug/metabolite transporter (DMT)-like permease